MSGGSTEGVEAPGEDANGLIGDPKRSYRREGHGLEFDRVAVFADAVYAIALTLIVVGIDVPSLADGSSGEALLDALNDQLPSITMFFIAFLVIGSYWIAHHRFVALLGKVDSRFISLHLVYLALIAFLPFPAAVLGQFDGNAVAVSLFAVMMAATSGMETVLYWTAHSRGLFAHPMSEGVFRWSIIGSLVPVVTFLVSIPVTFLAPYLAMLVWVLAMPAGMVTDHMSKRASRRAPLRQPSA